MVSFTACRIWLIGRKKERDIYQSYGVGMVVVCGFNLVGWGVWGLICFWCLAVGVLMGDCC